MQVIDNPQYNTVGIPVYKFDLTTTSQEVYHSILRGITRSDFCVSHGRPVVLPESARRFSIPDLVKMHDYVMHHATDENIRNWAYIIMSIGLFLRQDEAANLLLSSITPATDPNSGEPIITPEGLPHCLVVTIKRDKTNQDGPGMSYNIMRMLTLYYSHAGRQIFLR